MPGCRYVEETNLAAILATKRSAGVTPEVNLRKGVTHMPPPSANKALKPRGDITRSAKQEYQFLHKKDSCLQKFLKKAEANFGWKCVEPLISERNRIRCCVRFRTM